MRIDFSAVDRVNVKLADLQHQYTREDLVAATETMLDTILEMVRGVPDAYVTFQPVDPHAHDNAAATEAEKDIAWTLGHVIVHLTASGEETAALGSILARGVPFPGRVRYEVPWETMQTTAQLVHRLEESRRMRLAYLNAWPDDPHLDNYFTKIAVFGDLNAVGYTLLGLSHDTDHLGQIADIIRQASESTKEAV